MSMFRTLQQQPRTVTIFTHISGELAKLTNLQREITALKCKERQNKLKLDIHHAFPTWDQLKYMNTCEPRSSLIAQIPKLDEVLTFSQDHKIFQSKLSNLNVTNRETSEMLDEKANIEDILDLDSRISQRSYWNSNTSLYVDWEKQSLKLIQLYKDYSKGIHSN